jgi:hypothetical protein
MWESVGNNKNKRPKINKIEPGWALFTIKRGD